MVRRGLRWTTHVLHYEYIDAQIHKTYERIFFSKILHMHEYRKYFVFGIKCHVITDNDILFGLSSQKVSSQEDWILVSDNVVSSLLSQTFIYQI